MAIHRAHGMKKFCFGLNQFMRLFVTILSGGGNRIKNNLITYENVQFLLARITQF